MNNEVVDGHLCAGWKAEDIDKRVPRPYLGFFCNHCMNYYSIPYKWKNMQEFRNHYRILKIKRILEKKN